MIMKVMLILPRAIRNKEEASCIELLFETKTNFQEVLKNFLQERYSLIFNENGECKGFAKCFHNNECIDSLHDFLLEDGDEIEIITSMSGG